MHPIYAKADETPAIPILFVNAATFEKTITGIDDREQVYVRATGYEPKPGRHLIVPKADGTIAGVLFGIEAADEPVKDPFRPGQLVTLLPAGLYRFANGGRRMPPLRTAGRGLPPAGPAADRRPVPAGSRAP